MNASEAVAKVLWRRALGWILLVNFWSMFLGALIGFLIFPSTAGNTKFVASFPTVMFWIWMTSLFAPTAAMYVFFRRRWSGVKAVLTFVLCGTVEKGLHVWGTCVLERRTLESHVFPMMLFLLFFLFLAAVRVPLAKGLEEWRDRLEKRLEESSAVPVE